MTTIADPHDHRETQSCFEAFVYGYRWALSVGGAYPAGAPYFRTAQKWQGRPQQPWRLVAKETAKETFAYYPTRIRSQLVNAFHAGAVNAAYDHNRQLDQEVRVRANSGEGVEGIAVDAAQECRKRMSQVMRHLAAQEELAGSVRYATGVGELWKDRSDEEE